MELKSSNKVDVNRWELEIAISPEQFEKEVEKVYNKQKGKISVPGFRKGKAPRAFIEKYYGSGVFYQDAVNAIYLYAPQFEDLETLLERNNILYVLPQYLNVYKELWEALGKPNKQAEILPMPDEYLYYYDN